MAKFKEVSAAEFDAALKAAPADTLVRDVARWFDPPMERYHDEATHRLVAYRVLHDDRPAKCFVEDV